jgi:hypothetical protein
MNGFNEFVGNSNSQNEPMDQIYCGTFALPLFKGLNRRIQRRSMPWAEVSRRLKHWDLPLPWLVEKRVKATLPSGKQACTILNQE